MDIDMNNVYLNHKGYRISIAQHRTKPVMGKQECKKSCFGKMNKTKV